LYGWIRDAYLKRVNLISTFAELGYALINIDHNISIGASAAAVSQFFTLPLSVLSTRLQTQHSSNTLQSHSTYSILISILKSDGLKGLYKGLGASLVLCVNPAITYGIFERLKTILVTNRMKGGGLVNAGIVKLSAIEAFILGALSKSIATIVTCMSYLI